MANPVSYEKEVDKVMDFICKAKEGEFTAEKPDLTSIIYSRIERNVNDVFNEYSDEIILYGIS
jgi:hypothetical protein